MSKNIKTKQWSLERGILSSIKDADDGSGAFSVFYVEVLGNTRTRHIWGIRHQSLGHNEHTVINDREVFKVGDYAGTITRKELIRDTEIGHAYMLYEANEMSEA
jgi:hypothetical protein